MVSKMLPLVLMALAVVICCGLAQKKNMWVWTVVYWAMVSFKYMAEVAGW